MVISEVERRVLQAAETAMPAPARRRIRLAASARTPVVRMLRAILRDYPQRAVLGLVLMTSQAFFYNAIFFSYALVLTRFYGVPSASIGWYMLPFALGNFCRAALLGPLFDTIGRKPMIAATYALSGVLLAIVGWLFREGSGRRRATDRLLERHLLLRLGGGELGLSDGQRELPAGGAGTGDRLLLRGRHRLGGVASPWLFGILVGSGDRGDVFCGYLFGAALMVGAALVELAIGVKAERQPLESVARPLSAIAD